MTLTRTEIDTLEKFDLPSKRHINCIRFDAQSGQLHRRYILQLAEEAMAIGHNFLTRARLETHSDSPFSKEKIVADFVDLSTGEVCEVAVSEGEKSLERKRKIYEKYGLGMLIIRDRKKKEEKTVQEVVS